MSLRICSSNQSDMHGFWLFGKRYECTCKPLAPDGFLLADLKIFSACVTTETRHLDRLGQLGEFEQDSNTES